MGKVRAASGLLLILQSIIALIWNRPLQSLGAVSFIIFSLLWPLKSFKFPHRGLRATWRLSLQKGKKVPRVCPSQFCQFKAWFQRDLCVPSCSSTPAIGNEDPLSTLWLARNSWWLMNQSTHLSDTVFVPNAPISTGENRRPGAW